MSDDETGTCNFGTQLPQLADDVIPTKRPITIADQIAVDSNGKRRFHGAFTGGFSAGFWNTVGSQEGWQPKEFKSSRQEKADRLVQAPTDFMDDEDVGEFGIAPQRIQTTEDFSATKGAADGNKRRHPLASDAAGPIPGTPVLNLFLKPAKDRASVSLLKKMGWRENQGIGSRLTRTEKKKSNERNAKEMSNMKVYNVDMGPIQRAAAYDAEDDDDEESNSDDEDITFAPDDFEPLVQAFKTNRFGLGYVGLNKNTTISATSSQHVNLFAPFELTDRKNKKLSITGQAFGVGAFEEDDDDIYAKEDMATYDFTLERKQVQEKQLAIEQQKSNIIMGFSEAKFELNQTHTKMYEVDAPALFRPRNFAMRKTRFSPVSEENAKLLSESNEGFRRHMLTAEERGRILNDPSEVKPKPAQTVTLAAESNLPNEIIVENRQKIDPEPLKPAEVTKAKNFIKLSDRLAVDRFVSEKDLVKEAVAEVKKEVEVVMKRTKSTWVPCPLLCQRMNIAEPIITKAKQKGNSSGFSIFECLSETKKNRKKQYRERPDIIEVFTSAKTLDNDEIPSRLLVSSSEEKKIDRPSKTISAELSQIPLPPVPDPSTERQKNVIVPLKPPPIVPKTELEKNIQNARDKHPSEKKDLYKSIFDSSDEEDDDEKAYELEVEPEKQSLPTLPAESSEIFNLLRNTSPPRGIFANFFAKKSEAESSTAKANEAVKEQEESQDLNMYGPSLPTNLPKKASTSLHSFSRPQQNKQTNLPNNDLSTKKTPESIKSSKSTKIIEEWVDKDEVVRLLKDDLSKNKKKHKKSEKKSKKHKKEKLKKCKKSKSSSRDKYKQKD